MLNQCIECNFFVSSKEPICPNCGLAKPLQQFFFDETNNRWLRPFLIAIITAPLILLFHFFDRGMALQNFWISFVVFSMCIAFASTVSNFFKDSLFAWLLDREKKIRLSGEHDYLTAKKRIIENRIDELEQHIGEINSVLEQTDNLQDEQWQSAQEKLLTAREIVTTQLARYFLQSKKIELVRLQNKLTPFLFNTERRSFEQTEKKLQTIKSTTAKIGKIRKELADKSTSDLSSCISAERKDFLAELAETEASGQQLEQELIRRQSFNVVANVSLLAENLEKDLSANNLTRELTAFNIRTKLTDFSTAFDKLEIEYEQLKSKSDISNEFGTNLKNI